MLGALEPTVTVTSNSQVFSCNITRASSFLNNKRCESVNYQLIDLCVKSKHKWLSMFHTSKFDSLIVMSVQWFISELWHWGVFWQACRGLMICCWALTCTLALSQFVCILSQGWSLMAVHDREVAKFYLIIGGNQSCFAAEACWPAAELFWTIIDISRLSLFLENIQCYFVDYLKHLDQILKHW